MTKSSGKSSGLTPKSGVEIPRKLLVRMGRLELPRPLQALEPKSSASANSATSAQPHTKTTSD